MVFKPGCTSESSAEIFKKHRVLDPTSKYFDILDLGWGPGIFIVESLAGSVDIKPEGRTTDKRV